MKGEESVDSGQVDAACEQSDPVGESPACQAREVLQRVGDKWSVYVIDLLGQGTMRFTELHRTIDGITSRMLTVTLRGLERDGIVTRTIHPVIPPRVEYALTEKGRALLPIIDDMRAYGEDWLGEECAELIAPDALSIA